MAFPWDQYNNVLAEQDSRPLLRQDDKDALIKSGETFLITGVRHGKTKYGDRWFVDITRQDGSDAALAFATPSFERRDQLLAGLADHFGENGAQPESARLVMWGERAYGLESA